MLPKPPLHRRLTQLRAELRAGIVSPDTPPQLLQAARAWDTLVRFARDPTTEGDILRVCGLVSECAVGMVRTRRRVPAVLERLTQAPDRDLGRIDRALADFCGLDPLDYYLACQLALWTEADRLGRAGGLIPQVIARKVAEAVEQNVPPGLPVEGVPKWEPSVLARVPLPEGLRIVQVASDWSRTTELLLSLHPEGPPEGPPEGQPDGIWGPSPTCAGARSAIQGRDRKSLRAWVNTTPANEEAKDGGLSVLVTALVESERLEEALEYLGGIRSRSMHDATALNAIRCCAGGGSAADAAIFLSLLPPGFGRVKGRVELLCANLGLSGDTAAAVAELEAVEEEFAGEEAKVQRDGERSRPRVLRLNLPAEVRRELATGWTRVVFARLHVGRFWEALDAARRVLDLHYRSLCIGSIIGGAQRNVTGADALLFAEAVMRAANEFYSQQHERDLLQKTVVFLARSGSVAGLRFGLDLIDEKMAGAESAAREEARQQALQIFVASPPCGLSWEETAAAGNGISSSAARARCLYVLALHAAVEGEWGQCERLERRAERSLEAVDPEATEPRLGSDSGDEGETPGIPEMLRWMRGRQHSDNVQFEPSQWFVEAIALAVSLRDLAQDALFAVGSLLIGSPPFRERGDLYRQVLRLLEDVCWPIDAAFFSNELSRRAKAVFWDPEAEGLAELQQPTPEKPQTIWSAPAGNGAAPHPNVLRKKFASTLAAVEEGPRGNGLPPAFLETAVERVLHPIRKPVVEALFAAARRMECSHAKTHFAAMVHALTAARGDTAEARWVANAARCFAKEAGVLSNYETEVKKRLSAGESGAEEPTRTFLKERINGLGFEAAFAEFAAEPEASSKVWSASTLFEKALATGDSRAFFRAFDLAGEAFVRESSKSGCGLAFEEASQWPRQIGRLPSRADRLYLLRRMWDWHDWFKMEDDYDAGILIVPAWAGQMAAVGEVDLALETVERLRYYEHRACGYAELALGCGLTRGDARAADFFARFVVTARESALKEKHQFAADLGLRRVAMACAEEGDHCHLLEAVTLGKEMLVIQNNGVANFCLLFHILEALSLANRKDLWGEVLDFVVQSRQTSGWNLGQMYSVVSLVWRDCRHHPEGFTLSARLGFLEKFCVMMDGVRPRKQWGAEEALLLHSCLLHSGDVHQILERFEGLSSCSPKVVESLLGRDLAQSSVEGSPHPPDDQMLRWIANLCPYSEDAALVVVGHVAGQCLHRNDWSALRTLARECRGLNLDWLENLAEAVLAGE